MSPSQLQSIFHVDSQNLVPHYEVIKLIHHGTSHHIKKRNVNNALPTTDKQQSDKTQPHHVKKDLSKSAYYSALKNSMGNSENNATTTKSNNKNINNDKNSNYENSASFDSSNYNNSNSNSNVNLNLSDKHIDLSNIKEHNVSISAFGDVYNLTLRPTDGLFKDGPQSLRMWSVQTDPNATQGLLYDEINEVNTNFYT